MGCYAVCLFLFRHFHIMAPCVGAGRLSFGRQRAAPLVLNIILGSLVLFVSFIFLRNYVESPFILFATFHFGDLAAGLPSLVMSGMEHILQILLSVSCLMLTMNILSNDERKPTRTVVLLLLCSPLITAARPEGAALVLIVSIVMAAKKRYVQPWLCCVWAWRRSWRTASCR